MKDQLLADGERQSSEQLVETHVPNPDAPIAFQRGTLLVGSKGVGKTFLLRHQKATRCPGAIYINLPKKLFSVAQATGIAGKTTTFDPILGRAVQGKTLALIACLAYEELYNDHNILTDDLTLLNALLPNSLALTPSSAITSPYSLRAAVDAEPLDAWSSREISHQLLVEWLAYLANLAPERLYLFLDRAEDVAIPCVQALLPLLDQSVPFITVIAARPAVAQVIPAQHNSSLVPGDHYLVEHIGVAPYSPAWMNFATKCITRYLEANRGSVQDNVDILWAVEMARDSIRNAILYSQFAIDLENVELRLQAMNRQRQLFLSSVIGELLPVTSDFRDLIREFQQKAGVARLETQSPFQLTIHIDDVRSQLPLLGKRGKLQEILLKALRAHAFYLPAGCHWHPYELPIEFALAPLLLWNGRNTRWIT